MFALRDRSGYFYVIKMDSYGYTVKAAAANDADATQFKTRREATDVRDSLDEYWRGQCVVYFI